MRILMVTIASWQKKMKAPENIKMVGKMKISAVCACGIILSTAYILQSEDSMSIKLETIASFSTSVAAQDENVKKNIRLACAKINGQALYPGSVFSFNGAVGEGSAKNGYVNGRVLYRDEVAYEPGGGICQLSSTLFNALLMAGCSIVERHRHFQPVSYVPVGLDATIKYGKKDLRVRNPHPFKLYMEADVNDSTLNITIKGEGRPGFRYDLYTEEDEITPPLQNNEKIRPGLTVHVYRRKYAGEKLVESMLLYKDYYQPVYEK